VLINSFAGVQSFSNLNIAGILMIFQMLWHKQRFIRRILCVELFKTQWLWMDDIWMANGRQIDELPAS
jgi:hypothetical protein